MKTQFINVINKGWPPIVAVVLILSGWELMVSWLQLDQWFLPSPSGIIREGFSSWPRLWLHTTSTLYKMLIGFPIGVLAGFLIAVVMHLFRPIKSALSPLLIISQNIPIIVLAPLFLVWFGYGMFPKIIVIVLVCFFPVAVSMLTGLVEADRALLNYMRMIGASRSQIFLKLELPSSLPYLFSGMRISATYSVMGAVIAEWLGASSGLGHYMVLSSKSFRNDRVFAVVLIIVVLSLLMFALVVLLQKLVIRWNSRSIKEGS
jgi:ABC-type nitrate/sulfonate/bicarbonate transport system permease component